MTVVGSHQTVSLKKLTAMLRRNFITETTMIATNKEKDEKFRSKLKK